MSFLKWSKQREKNKKPPLPGHLIGFGDYVFIDGTRAQFIDHDIFSTLEDFKTDAAFRGITVEFKGITRRKISYRKTDAIVQKTLVSE